MERSDFAAVFAHEGVAAAYRHRPPYPAGVFDVLAGLVVDESPAVLDIGAGEGALARPLAERVGRVDAVDVSAAMIAVGRERPGGRRENLRWIEGAAETTALSGPYGLVTAGASLHWMAWPALMARLVEVTVPGAYLAIVGHGADEVPWRAAMIEVIVRHSRNPDYDPDFSVIDLVTKSGHFEVAGSAGVGPVGLRQPVESYVEQYHSMSSLARELMPAEEAVAFDRALTEVVMPYAVDGVLEMDVKATVTWGRPMAGGG
ncbi:class I SAM-dependent methyltransferase [Phytomonospora sp. NPDC050363]|uniref:class I SAM-dependent methyltransferase n=1 Tax=Phytomonospora sp. NPDC050363 TaxID=3155642 RepID=UPI0033F3034F